MKPYYERNGITIYHGDCREILPHLPKVDLVLTDPPYGIGAYKTGSMGGGVLAKQSRFAPVSWDDAPIDATTVSQVVNAGRKAILWGGNYFELPPQSCWLVWDKVNGSNNFADCELAWTNLGGAVRKKSFRWQGMLQEDMANKETRQHPTQKPIQVMTWCLSFFPEAKTILDPFMGSGTTLVAAKNLGRKAIGIEIEEKYCEIAVKRLAQEVLAL